MRDEIGFGVAVGTELDLGTTICREVRDAVEPVIISDVQADPVFFNHPTPSMYGFRSYVSTPIVLPNGEVFGTLCALDRDPQDLSSPWLKGMFRLFAELIAFHLDAHQRLAAGAANLAESRADLASSQTDLATSSASLVDERSASELREQFIAVLGHDLRNPLASIDAGIRLLSKETLSDRGRSVIGLMNKSVDRMSGLINDVLDFARGRLGGGIAVEKTERVPLAPMLRQVVEELQGGQPDRKIVVELDDIEDCQCDPARIGQLLSNLVANALTHGASSSPILVKGTVLHGMITLSVSNQGVPIPPAAMAGLFKPFVRASARESKQGLGLGLYIASEVAKAHAGTLEVTSNSQATTFTFRMPA